MKGPSILLPAFAMLFLGANCGKQNVSNSHPPPNGLVENVATTRVSHSGIENYYEATGTVKARSTTDVSSNILGRIVTLRVVEGDTVSRGEVMVEIDNSESKAQLEKAQAGLREAEASIAEVARSAEAANAAVRTAEANKRFAETTFGRYQELYKRGSASAQEFDDARSKLDTAVSELDRARANVQTILAKNKQINARIEQAKADIENSKVQAGYTKIVSPISGIVVKKFAEVGATAAPGSPLLSIEDSSQYRLEAAVEESRLKLINVGNRVAVHIDALGEGEMMGTVAEVLPTSDAASRSYTVKIDLPASAGLHSGIYGLARFPLAQKDAITVPQTAIFDRGQLTGVYVVRDDGTVQFRIITAGKTSEGMTEVLSGISEGDEIAMSNIDKLNDGVRIR